MAYLRTKLLTFHVGSTRILKQKHSHGLSILPVEEWTCPEIPLLTKGLPVSYPIPQKVRWTMEQSFVWREMWWEGKLFLVFIMLFLLVSSI
jgi:hypothetical protein